MLINLRNALMAGKRLPYARRVEYIRSSGSQYINTRWMPIATASLKLRCAIHNVNGAPQVGCIQNNGKPYYNWFWTSNYMLVFYFGSYSNESANYIFAPSGTISLNQEHAISYNGATGKGSVDASQFSGSICNSVPTVPFYLFARNNRGTAELFCQMSIYGFTVELAGEKKLDLIPVIDLEGQAKMFDLVSGTYPEHYGTFTPGPEIGD